MADLRSYKVRDLEPDSRTVVERLLGRPLHENEDVTVMAVTRRPAPSLDARRAAAKRMDGVLKKAADNLRDVPDQVFDAAVDEAMAKVRRRR